MSEAVVVALITGGLTLIGTIITVLAANKNEQRLTEHPAGLLYCNQEET